MKVKVKYHIRNIGSTVASHDKVVCSEARERCKYTATKLTYNSMARLMCRGEKGSNTGRIQEEVRERVLTKQGFHTPKTATMCRISRIHGQKKL